jgi:hypothetical protein
LVVSANLSLNTCPPDRHHAADTGIRSSIRISHNFYRSAQIRLQIRYGRIAETHLGQIASGALSNAMTQTRCGPSYCGSLSLPQGPDLEDPVVLDGIIGLNVDGEKVRPAHPLVHGELGRDFGLLPRRQGRRTDDRLGGSAALDGLNLSIHRQAEGLIPDVPQAEAGLDHPIEPHRAEVDQLGVHQEARSPPVLGRKADRGGFLEEEPGGDAYDQRQADHP